MSWIVMARDECNEETRVSSNKWETQGEAYVEAAKARKEYTEYRSVWVEMLRDNDYYLNEWSNNYDGEEPDPHWMYD